MLVDSLTQKLPGGSFEPDSSYIVDVIVVQRHKPLYYYRYYTAVSHLIGCIRVALQLTQSVTSSLSTSNRNLQLTTSLGM